KAHNPDAKPRKVVNKFRCEWTGCAKAFQTRGFLTAHVRQVHTDERPFECPQCGRRFSNNQYLQHHIKCHSSDKPFKCQYPGCEYSTHQKASLDVHHERHDTTTAYKCPEEGCNKSFAVKLALNVHIKGCHPAGGRPYVCDWPGCEASYKNMPMYKRHKNTHLGVKQFVCDIEGCGKGWPACEHRFGSNDKLVDHMNAHQGLRVVECPVEGCDKTFTGKPSGLRVVECPVEGCDKTFTGKPSVRQHLKQVHKYKTTEGLMPHIK
ncbi:unnamed protein product, partial [Medioppia subpectinata]